MKKYFEKGQVSIVLKEMSVYANIMANGHTSEAMRAATRLKKINSRIKRSWR